MVQASTSAGKGGALYIKNPEGPINLESVSVQNSISLGDGGLVYCITDSATPTEVTISIKNGNTPRTPMVS